MQRLQGHRSLILNHYVLSISHACGLGGRTMKEWFLLQSRQRFVAPPTTALRGPEDMPCRQEFTFTPPRHRLDEDAPVDAASTSCLAPLRPNHRSDTPS